MGDSRKKRYWIFIALLVSGHALADWALDPAASHLGFGSVKNDLIAENHSFSRLAGSVTSNGEAVVTIDLTSVETNIPIRNERMMEMLLHTDKFAIANASTRLKMDEYAGLNVGGYVLQNLNIKIDLHGKTIEKSILVKVVKSSEQSIDVASLGPIYIHASQFAMSDGVEALRKIAGLQSIDLMVPVTIDLRFTQVATP